MVLDILLINTFFCFLNIFICWCHFGDCAFFNVDFPSISDLDYLFFLQYGEAGHRPSILDNPQLAERYAYLVLQLMSLESL